MALFALKCYCSDKSRGSNPASHVVDFSRCISNQVANTTAIQLQLYARARPFLHCLLALCFTMKNFTCGLSSFEKTVRNVKHIETNPNKILSNKNSSASCKFTEKYSEQSPDRAEQRSMQKDGEESKEERHKSEREREWKEREREERERRRGERKKEKEKERAMNFRPLGPGPGPLI